MTPSRQSASRAGTRRGVKLRADVATICGLIVAFSGIAGGLMLEGGRIKDIAQFTAAFIVGGGTLGAVLVSTPLPILSRAVKRMRHVIFDRSQPPDTLIDEIIGFATRARKNGLVSLETEAENIADPFLRKALNLAVDGADLQEIRKMMELQIDLEEQRAMTEARVFESAGGYSPTIGIIGAVLGLIQVMKNLANIDQVGHGIAVAFVATVYGVGLANLVLLPIGAKIKTRIRQDSQRKELMLEGIIAIVEGLNPKLIRNKLDAFKYEEPEVLIQNAKPRKSVSELAQPDARAAAARP